MDESQLRHVSRLRRLRFPKGRDKFRSDPRPRLQFFLGGVGFVGGDDLFGELAGLGQSGPVFIPPAGKICNPGTLRVPQPMKLFDQTSGSLRSPIGHICGQYRDGPIATSQPFMRKLIRNLLHGGIWKRAHRNEFGFVVHECIPER